MKKVIIILIVLVLLLMLAGFKYQVFTMHQKKQQLIDRFSTVSSFDQCVAAGLPILESYPAQCSTPGGKTFTQDVGNELEYVDLIKVNNPRPNQRISSPLAISGEARGTWYFEANFSAELIDAKGTSLGTIPVQAEGEWMTEAFVPFSGELTFEEPQTAKGKLIIKNANPSGLPENEKTLIIPVTFQDYKMK